MIPFRLELLEGLPMTLEEARARGLKEKVAYIIAASDKPTGIGNRFVDFLTGSLIGPCEVNLQLLGLFEIKPTDQELLLAFVSNVPQLLTVEVQVLNSPFSGESFTGFFFRKN